MITKLPKWDWFGAWALAFIAGMVNPADFRLTKSRLSTHFLPHDANTRAPGSATSFFDELAKTGLKNLRVVPRTPDKWLGIGYVRDVLPHCYFHKTNCDTPREVDGRKYPSGVACLKGYHKQVTPANKTLREMPEHDQFSHSADAFRTFGEAWRRGMIEMNGGQTHTPRAVGGPKPRARR